MKPGGEGGVGGKADAGEGKEGSGYGLSSVTECESFSVCVGRDMLLCPALPCSALLCPALPCPALLCPAAASDFTCASSLPAGKRRALIPPEVGYVRPGLLPQPTEVRVEGHLLMALRRPARMLQQTTPPTVPKNMAGLTTGFSCRRCGVCYGPTPKSCQLI